MAVTAEFEQALEATYPVLLRRARRLTGDPDDALDLAQETCLRAIKFADQYKEGSNFKAWAMKIEFNTFINNSRRAQSASILSLEAEQEESPDGTANPSFQRIEAQTAHPSAEHIAISNLGEQVIIEEIDQLSPAYRAAVQVVVIRDLSYKEAGSELSVRPGTIGSRLYRGLAVLIPRLERRRITE